MPPLLAAALVGAGAYAGLRALQRAVSRWSEIEADASRPAEAANPSARIEKDLGTLERDPATGVYRPVKPLS